jgi:quinol monooxygenase YgiN
MSTGYRVGRLMTMKAHPGRGNELATALLNVAIGLREFPGCEIYLINQNQTSPDSVYVVKVWADEASANAALEAARAATSTGVSTTDVLAMLSDEPQRIDLVPLGGVGLTDAG